eukprot:sb/3462334/
MAGGGMAGKLLSSGGGGVMAQMLAANPALAAQMFASNPGAAAQFLGQSSVQSTAQPTADQPTAAPPVYGQYSGMVSASEVATTTDDRSKIKCQIFYLAKIDPGGWIPAAAVQAVAAKEYSKFLKNIASFGQKHFIDKEVAIDDYLSVDTMIACNWDRSIQTKVTTHESRLCLKQITLHKEQGSASQLEISNIKIYGALTTSCRNIEVFSRHGYLTTLKGDPVDKGDTVVKGDTDRLYCVIVEEEISCEMHMIRFPGSHDAIKIEDMTFTVASTGLPRSTGINTAGVREILKTLPHNEQSSRSVLGMMDCMSGGGMAGKLLSGGGGGMAQMLAANPALAAQMLASNPGAAAQMLAQNPGAAAQFLGQSSVYSTAQPTAAQPVSGQYSGMVSASEVATQLGNVHLPRTAEKDEIQGLYGNNSKAEPIEPDSPGNRPTRPLSRDISNEDRLTRIETTQQEMKREIESLRTELRDTKSDIISTLHQMQSNMTNFPPYPPQTMYLPSLPILLKPCIYPPYPLKPYVSTLPPYPPYLPPHQVTTAVMSESGVSQEEWVEQITSVYYLCMAMPNPLAEPLYCRLKQYLVEHVKRYCNNTEPTKTSKQPIRTRYLDHVTGYQPIRGLFHLSHHTGVGRRPRNENRVRPMLCQCIPLLSNIPGTSTSISRRGPLRMSGVTTTDTPLRKLKSSRRFKIFSPLITPPPQLAMNIWRDEMLEKVHEQLVSAILQDITYDRRGVSAHSGILKDVIHSFVEFSPPLGLIVSEPDLV